MLNYFTLSKVLVITVGIALFNLQCSDLWFNLLAAFSLYLFTKRIEAIMKYYTNLFLGFNTIFRYTAKNSKDLFFTTITTEQVDSIISNNKMIIPFIDFKILQLRSYTVTGKNTGDQEGLIQFNDFIKNELYGFSINGIYKYSNGELFKLKMNLFYFKIKFVFKYF